VEGPGVTARGGGCLVIGNAGGGGKEMVRSSEIDSQQSNNFY